MACLNNQASFNSPTLHRWSTSLSIFACKDSGDQSHHTTVSQAPRPCLCPCPNFTVTGCRMSAKTQIKKDLHKILFLSHFFLELGLEDNSPQSSTQVKLPIYYAQSFPVPVCIKYCAVCPEVCSCKISKRKLFGWNPASYSTYFPSLCNITDVWIETLTSCIDTLVRWNTQLCQRPSQHLEFLLSLCIHKTPTGVLPVSQCASWEQNSRGNTKLSSCIPENLSFPSKKKKSVHAIMINSDL